MCSVCAKMLKSDRDCIILNVKHADQDLIEHVLVLNFNMPLDDPNYTPMYKSHKELVMAIGHLSGISKIQRFEKTGANKCCSQCTNQSLSVWYRHYMESLTGDATQDNTPHDGWLRASGAFGDVPMFNINNLLSHDLHWVIRCFTIFLINFIYYVALSCHVFKRILYLYFLKTNTWFAHVLGWLVNNCAFLKIVTFAECKL